MTLWGVREYLLGLRIFLSVVSCDVAHVFGLDTRLALVFVTYAVLAKSVLVLK